jgi:hypothetical protein
VLHRSEKPDHLDSFHPHLLSECPSLILDGIKVQRSERRPDHDPAIRVLTAVVFL